jgi:HAD superfamily hydrolase (TIGR01549 family)
VYFIPFYATVAMRIGAMKRTIVFDFDGTIADSVHVCLDAFNQLAGVFGYPVMTLAQWRMAGFSEAMQEKSLSFFAKYRWFLRLKKAIYRNIDAVTPFPRIVPVVHELKKRGYPLSILTSNFDKNVRRFLRTNNMDMFDHVWCINSLPGKDKALKKFCRRRGITARDCLYIGDTSSDIIACKNAGIEIIAVGWGFNDISVLRSHTPAAVIESPGMLIETIESLDRRREEIDT